jgi:hypothetical protein
VSRRRDDEDEELDDEVESGSRPKRARPAGEHKRSAEPAEHRVLIRLQPGGPMIDYGLHGRSIAEALASKHRAVGRLVTVEQVRLQPPVGAAAGQLGLALGGAAPAVASASDDTPVTEEERLLALRGRRSGSRP